jgi:hypothetical protein
MSKRAIDELTEAFEEKRHELQLALVDELRARGMSEDEIDTEVCLLEMRLEHELLEQIAAFRRGFDEGKERPH